MGVKVLQVAFRADPGPGAGRSISWVAWGAMVLWVSGLLPLMLEELDESHWKVGDATMSLRTIEEQSDGRRGADPDAVVSSRPSGRPAAAGRVRRRLSLHARPSSRHAAR